MKTPTILVALLVICGLWLSPSETEASAGYMIDDTTAVFFIDFAMDANYADFNVPLVADHTVTYNDRVDVVGYEITDKDGEAIATASVSGIILSYEPLRDMRYQVTQGSVGAFRLLSIVTFAEPVDTAVSAAITKLPFWANEKRTSVHANQIVDLTPAIAAIEN